MTKVQSVNKPIHFVQFVLKFIDKLSLKMPSRNNTVKLHLSDSCVYSQPLALVWNEGIREVNGSRL